MHIGVVAAGVFVGAAVGIVEGVGNFSVVVIIVVVVVLWGAAFQGMKTCRTTTQSAR